MSTYQTLPILFPPKYGTTRSIILTNGGVAHVPTISNGTAQSNLKALSYPQSDVKQPSSWNDMKTTPSATDEGCSIYMSAQPASKSVVRGPGWSWCSTVWAVIATVFCASFCGFIGLLCAIHAYVDHKTGDNMGRRYKTKCSWCFTWFGIIIGLAVIATIVVLNVVYGYNIYI